MNVSRSILLIGMLGLGCLSGWAQRNAWVNTWAASPEGADADESEPLLKIENQTVRERVRVSIGGSQIRLRLSNEYGSAALRIGSVTVALANGDAAVQRSSLRAVTFAGHESTAIPAGAPILSDAVNFPIKAAAEISISIYFVDRVTTPTLHSLALKRAVVSSPGDHTRDEKIEGGTVSNGSISLTAVLVPAQRSPHVIVAFGDSIVDGDRSTVDADRNWTSDLIRRLQRTGLGSQIAVVNEGIAGNRILSNGPLVSLGINALARFDRDALDQPGVTHVILLEGINDIGFPGAKVGDINLADPADVRTTDQLIDAYKQLIARAHSQGVKVIGCTLLPFQGVVFPGYYSDIKEATRQQVNSWIRSSGVFDGVIDFDRVLRDPERPGRIAPRFASDDHLHPNDAGYQAMADSIDVSLLR